MTVIMPEHNHKYLTLLPIDDSNTLFIDVLIHLYSVVNAHVTLV